MDIGGSKSRSSESQESDEPAPPGTADEELQKKATTSKLEVKPSTPSPTFSTKPTAKGVENAKKRLRAFSIQKKQNPLPSVPVPKAVITGNTTVLIGKLSSVKVTPKPEKVDDDQKKVPRPPKPGGSKKNYMESYSALQKRTLSEIEDMKRKMELVELGIPLGLICPSTNEKAMPTKAMPPIKSFLDPAKVDEIIREAKQCRAEGREFKFDYQKLLPDYDNPFQRTKRDEQLQQLLQQQQQQEQPEQPQTPIKDKPEERKEDIEEKKKDRKEEVDRRRSDKYDKKYSYRREDRHRERDRSRDADEKNKREKTKDKEEKSKRDAKETKVDLSDYLVCDSWSLDERNNSPHVDEKLDIANIPMPKEVKAKNQTDKLKETSIKDVMDSPKEKPVKIERLQPVIDSFEFEIDPNEEDDLDVLNAKSTLEKFPKPKKHSKNESPCFDSKISKDTDDINDDVFLESVLNEIKEENMSEDENEKGLVEYDMSPDRDNLEYSKFEERSSVTPELDDRALQSQRSDYSDTRSTDSGIKSTESGYRSQSSRRSRLSAEKDFEPDMEDKLASSTVDSLETWSFVLKICQPLLFRHDRNRCFKETRALPKVWHSVSPKVCACVKGRAVVYDELEMCKSDLVDRVYHCDQFPESPITKARNWYPPLPYCLVETSSFPTVSEWEDTLDTETKTDKRTYKDSRADKAKSKTDVLENQIERTESKNDRKQSKTDRLESRTDSKSDRTESKADRTDSKKSKSKKNQRLSMTPERNEEVSLDIEYQRFMEAVCFDVTESKSYEGTEPKQEARSTTPVRQEPKKKKKKMDSEMKQEADKQTEDVTEKKTKSNEAKLSEGWSQESMDDEEEKSQENKRKKKLEADEAEKRAASEAAKKRKMSADNWSQESDLEEHEVEKSKKEKHKVKDKTRKRKRSTSTISSDSDSEDLKKKRKALKKKALKSTKSKSAKRRKLGKKILKRLKEKKKKKVKEAEEIEQEEEVKATKKKDKKLKKKKHQKLKKKAEKKKKKKTKSSSSSSTSSASDSSSESESEGEKNVKKKKKNKKKKKRQPSTSSSTSHSEELFDVNVLNNIKTERLVEEEPQRSHREIISVQQLQDDFSINVKIKQEVEEGKPESEAALMNTFELSALGESPAVTPPEVQVGQEAQPLKVDDTNHSQSSQDSVVSVKEPPQEKEESPSRPSLQDSQCSFQDAGAGAVAADPGQYKSAASNQYKTTEEDKYPAYEESYEMYEHLAMAYQSDVASQQRPLEPPSAGEQRIETVVRSRACGEIKCDWRRSDPPAPPPHNRPSRWGLKPGEVNIVLTGGGDTAGGDTGGGDQYPIQSLSDPVYKIQSLANRNDTAQTSCYDEAYMDMYGAMDRLQYGDCFAPPPPSAGEPTHASLTAPAVTSANTVVPVRNTLDDRIDRALRETVLGEVAKDRSEGDKDSSDKGILVTKSLEGRSTKRVSFADGYKPGQDSDTEQPPLKKRKKRRRAGCAWPCPATHPDHVPLWDALPPPPPPPGSPPPPPRAAPPLHLLRPPPAATLTALPYPMQKFDASAPIPNFMPPEPPPGLINFT